MTQSPISTLMRRQVCRVSLDDSVAQVQCILLARRLNWVPVVDGEGTSIGVVSAADLLRFHAEGGDAEAVRAWQLCTYKPVSVAPDTAIGEVARRMVERAVHHVVVVDDSGICGVVSSMDFVRACAAPEAQGPGAARLEDGPA